MSKRSSLAAMALVLSLTGVVGSAVAAAEGDQPTIAPPSTQPYGASYQTWAARWTEWAFEAPAASNPLVAPSCATSQVGRIWYMPHTFIGNSAKLHCTISDRTPILLSAGGGICDETEGILGTYGHLRTCAEDTLGQLSRFRVFVDGVLVENLDEFRLTSRMFRLDYPVNNIFEVRPGSYRAVTAGYFLMLRPLSPGRHTIVVYDEFEGEAARVTAFLKVVARR